MFFKSNPDPALLARIEELEALLQKTERKLQREQQKNWIYKKRVALFKDFSPKLWFEYFSMESGKNSKAYLAWKAFNDWLDEERRQGRQTLFRFGGGQL